MTATITNVSSGKSVYLEYARMTTTKMVTGGDDRVGFLLHHLSRVMVSYHEFTNKAFSNLPDIINKICMKPNIKRVLISSSVFL